MPRSEYVYLVGYESPDFMGAWTVKREMLKFLDTDDRCDYAFLKNCWVARLKDNDPGYFESMHEDSDVLVIQEAKRVAEGIDPEPGEVQP
jgi:hypothetical protein